MAELSPTQPRGRAIARGRAFDLLGDLLLFGPRRRDHLLAVPSLAVHLTDPEADAAEHYRVFQLEVVPRTSFFLHPEGLVGGDEAERATRLMAEGGYATDHEAPDHLGVGLRYLAFLSGAEADAHRDEEPAHFEQIVMLQSRFTGETMRWFPLFQHATRSTGSPLYVSAVELVEALFAERTTPAAWSLPELPDILAEPRTGLATIARHLAVPSRSGIAWTPTVLHRIASEIDIPHGFGKRWQILENLLTNAAHYERLPALVEHLQVQLDGVEALLGAGHDPWRQRLASTRRLLEALAAGQASQ